jgi:hypothetical protein
MILSRCVDKHGRGRQFLFLLCRLLKTFSCKITFTFTGSIYGRSFIRFHRDCTIQQGRHGQFLFTDWLTFKKSSLKLGGTMNCFSVEIMYERSCKQFSYFVSIIQLWRGVLDTTLCVSVPYEHVSITCHFVLRKLYTEQSTITVTQSQAKTS